MDSAIRHTWFDRVLPWLLGAGVAALAWFTGNSLEFPPELWDEVAVAARIRPPAHEFPLLWQGALSLLIDAVGIGRSVEVLKILGPLSLGLLAVLVFVLFGHCLPKVMRTDMNRPSWGRRIVWSILVQGTLFFVCSEPVWRAGRVFSPEMAALLLSVVALISAISAVERASPFLMILSGAVSGVLAAEIPLAVLVPSACGLFLHFRYLDPSSGLPPLANPIIFISAVRRTAWAFVLCWIGAVAVNVAFHTANGGGADAGVFIAFVKYLMNFFHAAKSSMTLMGCLFVSAVVILPLVISVAKIRSVTDVRRFMSVPYACFFAAAGFLAFMQCTGLDGCRFWDWAHGAVRSRYVLCMCMLGTSLTAVFALSAFAVELFFRNHARLLRDEFPEASEGEPLALRTLRSLRLSARLLRFPAKFVPVVSLALVVPSVFDSTAREMASVVNGAVRQTAEECGGAAMLFTDGSLDAAVEVAAAAEGKKLKALSMMSGAGSHDVAVRLRGETNEEYRTLLSIGAADALRTWVRGSHPCASNIALQVGLELWRHADLPVPASGGLVSRTAGFPEGAAARYAGSARRLGERMLELYAGKDPLRKGYPELNGFFLFTQWRLSRMCRMRANEADAVKDAKRSEEEHSLADRLDALNSEWMKVQEKMDWIGRQSGMRLTPREGLKLGLERADFRLARSYARRVITTDEDDVQANFALGMGFLTEKQYGRAEMHLKKCLKRAPEEPAVLNNLAIVQLRLGRFAEAETNALKALKHFPGSSEIKTTLRHIRAAAKKGGK